LKLISIRIPIKIPTKLILVETLHTTKLPIPAVNNIHTFSAQSKLCFVRDQLSGKDFLVDTGATLSLLPPWSADVVTGPKLQSVKGQPIKTWNFVKTRVEFNGWERKFAFLQADVPFPISGLEFFEIFQDAGKPLIFRNFGPLPLSAQSGRRHHQRRWQKCRPCVFFGQERGARASAEICRRCLLYSP
jgi:predicted aspartyl protease